MVFEELFEELGKIADNMGKKIDKKSEEIRHKMDKAREDVSDDFVKKMNRLGEKFSVENKHLSNFERAVASVAIGVAHSLEEGYKKVKKELFLTEKERKTKYGILGKVWSEKYVPRERANFCMNYAKGTDARLGNHSLKREILRDAVESLSSSDSELYGYYVHHHFTGSKRSNKHDEKKKVVKNILMSKEQREFYGKKG